MSHPLHNPYNFGIQSSIQRQNALSSSGASSGTSETTLGTIPSPCAFPVSYTPPQSSSILDGGMKRSTEMYIGQAREEMRHQSINQPPCFTSTQKDKFISSTATVASSPVCSASQKHSDFNSGPSSLDWSSYNKDTENDSSRFFSSSASLSFQGSSESIFNTFSERERDMQSIPGLGDSDYRMQDKPVLPTDSRFPKYSSQEASNILLRFGLEKEDLEYLISYPEDQITPDNLPFILRQIRMKKAENVKPIVHSKPCPEPQPTPSMTVLDSFRSEGMQQDELAQIIKPSKVIDYGHTSKYTGGFGSDIGRSSGSRSNSGGSGSMLLMDAYDKGSCNREPLQESTTEVKTSTMVSSRDHRATVSTNSSMQSYAPPPSRNPTQRIPTQPNQESQEIISSFSLPKKDTDLRLLKSKLVPKKMEPDFHLGSKTQPPSHLARGVHPDRHGLVLIGSNDDSCTKDQSESQGQGPKIAEPINKQKMRQRQMQHELKKQMEQQQNQKQPPVQMGQSKSAKPVTAPVPQIIPKPQHTVHMLLPLSSPQCRTVRKLAKGLPALPMMQDYAAATPQTFPHTCSLCLQKCTGMKDWLLHQNTSFHLNNCKLLRKRYPQWDGKVLTKVSRFNPRKKLAPSPFGKTSQHPHEKTRQFSRSRSCSRSPHRHLGSDGRRPKHDSCSRSRSKSPHHHYSSRGRREKLRSGSRSPHSSRHTRRSRSRSFSPRYDYLASFRYRSRSRSRERRSSPRRRDEKQLLQKRSDERRLPTRRRDDKHLPLSRSHKSSSSEDRAQQKNVDSSTKRLAKQLLETTGLRSLSKQSDLEAMAKTLAPVLLAEIAKMKSPLTSLSSSASTSSSSLKKEKTTKSSESKPGRHKREATTSLKPKVCKSLPSTAVKLQGIVKAFSHEEVVSAVEHFGKTESIVLYRSNLEAKVNFMKEEDAQKLKKFKSIYIKGVPVTVVREQDTVKKKPLPAFIKEQKKLPQKKTIKSTKSTSAENTFKKPLSYGAKKNTTGKLVTKAKVLVSKAKSVSTKQISKTLKQGKVAAKGAVPSKSTTSDDQPSVKTLKPPQIGKKFQQPAAVSEERTMVLETRNATASETKNQTDEKEFTHTGLLVSVNTKVVEPMEVERSPRSKCLRELESSEIGQTSLQTTGGSAQAALDSNQTAERVENGQKQQKGMLEIIHATNVPSKPKTSGNKPDKTCKTPRSDTNVQESAVMPEDRARNVSASEMKQQAVLSKVETIEASHTKRLESGNTKMTEPTEVERSTDRTTKLTESNKGQTPTSTTETTPDISSTKHPINSPHRTQITIKQTEASENTEVQESGTAKDDVAEAMEDEHFAEKQALLAKLSEGQTPGSTTETTPTIDLPQSLQTRAESKHSEPLESGNTKVTELTEVECSTDTTQTIVKNTETFEVKKSAAVLENTTKFLETRNGAASETNQQAESANVDVDAKDAKYAESLEIGTCKKALATKSKENQPSNDTADAILDPSLLKPSTDPLKTPQTTIKRPASSHIQQSVTPDPESTTALGQKNVKMSGHSTKAALEAKQTVQSVNTIAQQKGLVTAVTSQKDPPSKTVSNVLAVSTAVAASAKTEPSAATAGKQQQSFINLTAGERIEKIMDRKYLNCFKENTFLSKVLLITNLPEYHNSCYTEVDIANQLTLFGFQYIDDDIYVLPQMRMAFAIAPSLIKKKRLIKASKEKSIMLNGSTLCLEPLSYSFPMNPFGFYNTLMKLVNYQITDDGSTVIYIKNISPSEASDLREALKKIGSIKNYLPLLNKVFIEFESIYDADRLGVWYSLLKQGFGHNVYRIKIPRNESTSRPPRLAAKALPDSKDAIEGAIIPTANFGVPQGSAAPFWVAMKTYPFVFPTASPWFVIPDFLTVQLTKPQKNRAPGTVFPHIMLTGLPEGNYRHEDVAKLVWRHFPVQNLHTLYYNIIVLSLQRRAFVYFSDWNACNNFVQLHKKNPVSVGGRILNIHFMLQDMHPGSSEEVIYRNLMKWSNVHVPDSDSLEERLLCVEISETSVNLIMMVMQVVASSGCFVRFLPLANRIYIEVAESHGVTQVLEKIASIEHLSTNVIWNKIRRIETLKSLKQRLQDSSEIKVNLELDISDVKSPAVISGAQPSPSDKGAQTLQQTSTSGSAQPAVSASSNISKSLTAGQSATSDQGMEETHDKPGTDIIIKSTNSLQASQDVEKAEERGEGSPVTSVTFADGRTVPAASTSPPPVTSLIKSEEKLKELSYVNADEPRLIQETKTQIVDKMSNTNSTSRSDLGKETMEKKKSCRVETENQGLVVSTTAKQISTSSFKDSMSSSSSSVSLTSVSSSLQSIETPPFPCQTAQHKEAKPTESAVGKSGHKVLAEGITTETNGTETSLEIHSAAQGQGLEVTSQTQNLEIDFNNGIFKESKESTEEEWGNDYSGQYPKEEDFEDYQILDSIDDQMDEQINEDESQDGTKTNLSGCVQEPGNSYQVLGSVTEDQAVKVTEDCQEDATDKDDVLDSSTNQTLRIMGARRSIQTQEEMQRSFKASKDSGQIPNVEKQPLGDQVNKDISRDADGAKQETFEILDSIDDNTDDHVSSETHIFAELNFSLEDFVTVDEIGDNTGDAAFSHQSCSSYKQNSGRKGDRQSSHISSSSVSTVPTDIVTHQLHKETSPVESESRQSPRLEKGHRLLESDVNGQVMDSDTDEAKACSKECSEIGLDASVQVLHGVFKHQVATVQEHDHLVKNEDLAEKRVVEENKTQIIKNSDKSAVLDAAGKTEMSITNMNQTLRGHTEERRRKENEKMFSEESCKASEDVDNRDMKDNSSDSTDQEIFEILDSTDDHTNDHASPNTHVFDEQNFNFEDFVTVDEIVDDVEDIPLDNPSTSSSKQNSRVKSERQGSNVSSPVKQSSRSSVEKAPSNNPKSPARALQDLSSGFRTCVSKAGLSGVETCQPNEEQEKPTDSSMVKSDHKVSADGIALKIVESKSSQSSGLEQDQKFYGGGYKVLDSIDDESPEEFSDMEMDAPFKALDSVTEDQTGTVQEATQRVKDEGSTLEQLSEEHVIQIDNSDKFVVENSAYKYKVLDTSKNQASRSRGDGRLWKEKEQMLSGETCKDSGQMTNTTDQSNKETSPDSTEEEDFEILDSTNDHAEEEVASDTSLFDEQNFNLENFVTVDEIVDDPGEDQGTDVLSSAKQTSLKSLKDFSFLSSSSSKISKSTLKSSLYSNVKTTSLQLNEIPASPDQKRKSSKGKSPARASFSSSSGCRTRLSKLASTARVEAKIETHQLHRKEANPTESVPVNSDHKVSVIGIAVKTIESELSQTPGPEQGQGLHEGGFQVLDSVNDDGKTCLEKCSETELDASLKVLDNDIRDQINPVQEAKDESSTVKQLSEDLILVVDIYDKNAAKSSEDGSKGKEGKTLLEESPKASKDAGIIPESKKQPLEEGDNRDAVKEGTEQEAFEILDSTDDHNDDYISSDTHLFDEQNFESFVTVDEIVEDVDDNQSTSSSEQNSRKKRKRKKSDVSSSAKQTSTKSLKESSNSAALSSKSKPTEASEKSTLSLSLTTDSPKKQKGSSEPTKYNTTPVQSAQATKTPLFPSSLPVKIHALPFRRAQPHKTESLTRAPQTVSSGHKTHLSKMALTPDSEASLKTQYYNKSEKKNTECEAAKSDHKVSAEGIAAGDYVGKCIEEEEDGGTYQVIDSVDDQTEEQLDKDGNQDGSAKAKSPGPEQAHTLHGGGYEILDDIESTIWNEKKHHLEGQDIQITTTDATEALEILDSVDDLTEIEDDNQKLETFSNEVSKEDTEKEEEDAFQVIDSVEDEPATTGTKLEADNKEKGTEKSDDAKRDDRPTRRSGSRTRTSKSEVKAKSTIKEYKMVKKYETRTKKSTIEKDKNILNDTEKIIHGKVNKDESIQDAFIAERSDRRSARGNKEDKLTYTEPSKKPEVVVTDNSNSAITARSTSGRRKRRAKEVPAKDKTTARRKPTWAVDFQKQDPDKNAQNEEAAPLNKRIPITKSDALIKDLGEDSAYEIHPVKDDDVRYNRPATSENTRLEKPRKYVEKTFLDDTSELVTLDEVGEDEGGEKGVLEEEEWNREITEDELQEFVTLDEIGEEEEEGQEVCPLSPDSQSVESLNQEALSNVNEAVDDENEKGIKKEAQKMSRSEKRKCDDNAEDNVNLKRDEDKDEKAVATRTSGQARKRTRQIPVRKSVRGKKRDTTHEREEDAETESLPSTSLKSSSLDKSASVLSSDDKPDSQKTEEKAASQPDIDGASAGQQQEPERPENQSLEGPSRTDVKAVSKRRRALIKPEAKRSRSQSPRVTDNLDGDASLGDEHVVQKIGLFCNFCSIFYPDEQNAKDLHCRSQKHQENLKKHQQKLPPRPSRMSTRNFQGSVMD